MFEHQTEAPPLNAILGISRDQQALQTLSQPKCAFAKRIKIPPIDPLTCHHAPSTSLLLSLKKSASHSNGFSGSYTAKYFMPSNR